MRFEPKKTVNRTAVLRRVFNAWRSGEVAFFEGMDAEHMDAAALRLFEKAGWVVVKGGHVGRNYGAFVQMTRDGVDAAATWGV